MSTLLRRFRSMTGYAAVAASLGAAFHAGADDVLRCKNGLANVGMIAPQVLAKCGQPQDKTVAELPVRVRNANGTIATAGTTRVERWTYERGYGRFPAVFTFEDGKLKSIELVTRP
jgi:Protein of unknown function (DUF2845)